MAFALVSSLKAANLNGTTSTAIDTTGASLIVVSFAYNNSFTPTLSDNKGNTYTALTAYGTAPTVRLYYCISPTVGTGHTFTFGPSGITGAINVTAWSSSSSPAYDKAVGGNGSGSNIFVAGNTTGVTPANNNSLLVAGNAYAPGTANVAGANGWTLAQAQDGLGGNYYGCSTLYLTQTTAAAIASSTIIGTSSNGGNTTSTAVFYEAPTESLTITTPSAFEVHQRSGTTGSIQITGTVSGSTEDIEASFNGGAYQTIATAVPPGSFSGTLTGQTQGQGTLTVRKKTTTTTLATKANVGIGDVFIVAGDSISEGRGTNAQSYTHATLKAAKFRQDNAWGDGVDGIDTGTSAGSHWPLLATQIMADQGVPVAFISCGTGSTDVSGTYNSWAKPGAEYTGMTTQVTNSTVNGVKGALFHLGPNAAHNNPTPVLATYKTAIDTLASNLATDIVGAPKLNIGIFGEDTIGTPTDRRGGIDNVRGAIIQALNSNANVKPGPCLIDLDYSDGVHPQSDVHLQTVAARWWVALKETYYGGSGGRGPRLVSASWNGARNQLTVIFDRTLKTGLTFSPAAWLVKDNGSNMTVSSITYHGTNPAAIILNMSAAAVGAAGTTTLTFASANDAVGLVVPQSTDITMPVGSPITIPAEPILAATVSELDTTPPTLSAPGFTGNGLTTGNASVTTNEGNGTLYCVVTTNSTTPTVAQVQAGQNSSGTTAAYSSNQSITSTGAKSFSVTGLSSSTTYYAHFQHRDAFGNDSAVVSSSAGTTTTPAAPSTGSITLPRVGLTASGALIVLFP